MKKIFLILISGFIILFCNIGGVNAETQDEYFLKRDLYLTAHQNYLSAKTSYFNHHTLETKKVLIQNLKEFLLKRNEFLQSYFNLLLTQRSGFYAKNQKDRLEAWIVWLAKNKTNINASKTVDTLTERNDELTEVYPQMELAVYRFLMQTVVVEQDSLVSELEKVIVSLSMQLQEKDWLVAVTSELKKIVELKEKARLEFEEVSVRQPGDAVNYWLRAKKHLGEINLILDGVLDYINEAMERIGND